MTTQNRTTALARRDDGAAVVAGPISVGELKSRRNLILEAMRAMMLPGVHYDTIDGDRKFLTKAGAEMLAVLFGLSVDCEVVESRVAPDEVFFRVRATCSDAAGRVLAVQQGACSTGEDKYGWRAAVCPEEFQDAEPHMRRVKYSKGRGRDASKIIKVQQVRREAGEQLNTVLQMAAKRGAVAAVRSATGASDIFKIPNSGEEPGEDPDEIAAKLASEGDLRVVGIRDKRGESDRGPWVLFFVKLSDQREGATFDAGAAKIAERAMRESLAVKAVMSEGKKPGEWKLDLLELVPA